jgi:UTP--glucose-1-phosphate uridylyltransferase
VAVTRAVIPAAGLGTRNLPATKAIPKELLAIVDKPMIQYVVEEAVGAGITDVVIVTGPGKDALEAHFSPAPELEAELGRKGKTDLQAAVRRTSELANVTFVMQEQPLGLGHAVLAAGPVLGNEPFAVLLPDELFGGPDLLAALIEGQQRFGAPVIAVMEMPPEEISNYGVVDPELPEVRGVPDEMGPDFVRMKDFVEKPPAAEAKSNLGSVGRYVLDRAVLDALAGAGPGAGGEIQLTDGIASVARSMSAYAFVYRGARNDAGRPLGYVKATIDAALRDPQIADDVREYMSLAAARKVP